MATWLCFKECPLLMRKSLTKIEVETSAEAEEAVSEILNDLFGISPVVFHNFEKGTVSVSVYDEKGTITGNRNGLIEKLGALKNSGLDCGSLKVVIKPVKYEDWAESWKHHFKPLKFGKSLIVKPEWSKTQSVAEKVVILNPGLAFGTGQHATTKFCLQQIVKYRPRNCARAFLDVGTGSGILAIAAAKLGYAPVVAFDYDEEAVKVAAENCRKNRVLNQVNLFKKDVLKLPEKSKEKYDLICANLTADLLVEIYKKLIARLNKGGKLVLAGILNSQFEEVKQTYVKAGLKLLRVKEEKEWRSGLFSAE